MLVSMLRLLALSVSVPQLLCVDPEPRYLGRQGSTDGTLLKKISASTKRDLLIKATASQRVWMGSQFQLQPRKGLVFGGMYAENVLPSAGPTGSSE